MLLHLEGISVLVINRCLVAITFWFRIKGIQDVKKHLLLQQILRGYYKGWVFRNSRHLVSFKVLVSLGEKSALEFNCLRMLFRLLFSLAFFNGGVESLKLLCEDSNFFSGSA